MRYIEITHTYVIPVPAEDVVVIEPLAREGMSIMEGFMSARASNMRDLHSDWKLMPREYRPVQPLQEVIEQGHELTFDPGDPVRIVDNPPVHLADEPGEIDFVRDVMGQEPKIGHPWDDKIRITPPEGDIGAAETEALRQEGKLCGHLWPDQHDRVRECVLVAFHPGPHVYQLKPGYPEEIEG